MNNVNEAAPAVAAPTACSLRRRRDLAIDAAIRRMLIIDHPTISEKETQEKGSMEIGEGRYTVSFQGRPFALVEIEADDRFRLTVI